MRQVEGQVQRARFQKELDLSVAQEEGQRSCGSRSALAERAAGAGRSRPEVHSRVSAVR